MCYDSVQTTTFYGTTSHGTPFHTSDPCGPGTTFIMGDGSRDMCSHGPTNYTCYYFGQCCEYYEPSDPVGDVGPEHVTEESIFSPGVIFGICLAIITFLFLVFMCIMNARYDRREVNLTNDQEIEIQESAVV